MICGVGCRYGLDLVLLWRRPAATALIQPLAWEPPYALGLAERKERERERKDRRKGERENRYSSHKRVAKNTFFSFFKFIIIF